MDTLTVKLSIRLVIAFWINSIIIKSCHAGGIRKGNTKLVCLNAWFNIVVVVAPKSSEFIHKLLHL